MEYLPDHAYCLLRDYPLRPDLIRTVHVIGRERMAIDMRQQKVEQQSFDPARFSLPAGFRKEKKAKKKK